MLTRIDLDKAEGKKIKKVTYGGDHVVITFADDTFSALGIEYGYEHGDEEITDDDDYASGDERPHDSAVEAGVMSAEEYHAITKRLDDAFSQRVAESERRQFERLKAVFEPNGGAP